MCPFLWTNIDEKCIRLSWTNVIIISIRVLIWLSSILVHTYIYLCCVASNLPDKKKKKNLIPLNQNFVLVCAYKLCNIKFKYPILFEIIMCNSNKNKMMTNPIFQLKWARYRIVCDLIGQYTTKFGIVRLKFITPINTLCGLSLSLNLI